MNMVEMTVRQKHASRLQAAFDQLAFHARLRRIDNDGVFPVLGERVAICAKPRGIDGDDLHMISPKK